MIATRNWGSRRTAPLTINYVLLTLLLVFALGPLVVLGFNSLKTSRGVASNPLAPPLEGIQWQNYLGAWNKGNYATTIPNTLIIVAATVAGVLLVGGLAAYSLARLKVRGGDVLTMYLLVGTTLPAQLFLVPLFFLWVRLGLFNNLLGVIIIYWGTMSPFATFLLRAYMVSLPNDFEDAARVDGASEWQIFWGIIRPLSWPGFLTAGLITGLAAWNEFLFAVTFLQKPVLKTVAASLYSYTNRWERDWALTSAASVIMILPVLVLFMLLQRRFIAGLTQGGLKV
jgi:raffinose/stachyose/melibiose transport system permease protein